MRCQSAKCISYNCHSASCHSASFHSTRCSSASCHLTNFKGYLLVVPFLKACPVVEKYPVSSFFGAKTLTVPALCIKTFSITLKEHTTQNNTLCAMCCYAECHIFYCYTECRWQSVIILSVAVLLC
jgi:hypothetical protein